MLHNLYDYVEKTLKVILIFETYTYTGCKEFLIYGNLGKSELDNFLRTCSTESISCSSLCEIKKELRSKSYPTIEPQRRIIANKAWRSTFLQPVFALKKAEYKCFYEVIEQNNDISFVTLNVPLSKSLFMKIVNLKDIYAEYYTNCEMYMILKYVFPFKYRIKWMTSVACTHFNKNFALVNKLRQYSEDPEKYEFNHQTTFLSNILFGTDDIALNFRNAVNSYISFSLVGINDQQVSTTRKADTNKIIKVINLHELSIEFLFDNIYLNYSCLEQNDDVLNDKFNKHVHKRLLVVEIYDEETNINNVGANRNLYNNMSIVQKSKFLIGKNVGEIILNINEMPREINTSIFNYMNVVTIVRCRLHPNDFISTFPGHVQVILELCNVRINDGILSSHPNIIELVFIECEFESDILFLNNLKSVKLLRSTTIDGVILTFNRNIQRIMIESSKGQFNLSGIGGFNRIDIKKKNKTFFKYEKKEKYYCWMCWTCISMEQYTLIRT
ncbi:putative LRR containing protein [Trachipleistophora hominis]|uniref:Putative LRR containing protein n=1 Tax=Trachipleistophora hominis TaxID=72359 RepID=L7JW19_TRAHO|nr:putative LRR containing protein [Trachipleistophora hominis]